MNGAKAEQPGMVTVHSCWTDSEAAILVSVLRDHGIEAEVNSRVPHSVLPLTVDGLGEIQVMVAKDRAEEALELLEEQEAAGEALESAEAQDEDSEEEE